MNYTDSTNEVESRKSCQNQGSRNKVQEESTDLTAGDRPITNYRDNSFQGD